MSNVLIKKISDEPTVCGHTLALTSVWKNSAKKLSELLMKEAGILIEYTDVSIRTPKDAQLKTPSASSQLFYSARCGTSKSLCFLNLSTDLVKKLSEKILDEDKNDLPGSSIEINESAYLDLLLLEPIANRMIKAISDAMGDVDKACILSPLSPERKGLNPIAVGFTELNLTEISITFKCAETSDNFIIVLAFPRDTLANISLTSKGGTAEQMVDQSNSWLPRLLQTIHQAPLDISVTLENLNLNIAECSRLTVGQVIELPGASIENIAINVDTGTNFQKIGNGRLGIAHNKKAISLNGRLDEKFFKDLDFCTEEHASALKDTNYGTVPVE